MSDTSASPVTRPVTAGPPATDEQRFLAAILEAPADDAPRLVYADWLDERGDADRASFIRLQCRLAEWSCNFKQTKEQPGWFHDCGTDDRGYWLCQPLRSRERELLAANFGAWTDFLPDSLVTKQCPHCAEQSPDYETNVVECRRCDSTGVVADHDNVEFRRGFVESVTLPAAAFVGGRGLATYEEPVYGGTVTESRTLPGLAGQLFAAAPITAVTVSDREPWIWYPDAGSSSSDWPARYSWIDEDKQRNMGDADRRRAHVPTVLFKELEKLPGADIRLHEYARYDSPDAAKAALSLAAFLYGRAAAGLA